MHEWFCHGAQHKWYHTEFVLSYKICQANRCSFLDCHKGNPYKEFYDRNNLFNKQWNNHCLTIYNYVFLGLRYLNIVLKCEPKLSNSCHWVVNSVVLGKTTFGMPMFVFYAPLNDKCNEQINYIHMYLMTQILYSMQSCVYSVGVKWTKQHVCRKLFRTK